jgi:hypothetical protein
MADIHEAKSHDGAVFFRTQLQTSIKNNEDEHEISFLLNPNQPSCPPSAICPDLNEVAKTTSTERIIFRPKSQETKVEVMLPPAVKQESLSSSSNPNSTSLAQVPEKANSLLSASCDSQLKILNQKKLTAIDRQSIEKGVVVVKTTNEPLNSKGSIQLKWEPEELLRLRSWITCVCLVDFDLLVGQTIKFSYPSGSLSESEGQNVASLAFPDSNSSDVGSYNFCFRFRTTPGASDSRMSYPYLFGYVFFCQRPDSSIDRGYFQKSLVLVSHLPYTHLFLRVIEIIGPLFFRYGHPIIEASCRNISQWPCPTKEGKFTLPILGELVRTNIQPHNSPPYSHPERATKCLCQSQLIYPKDKNTQVKDSHAQNFTRMLAMGFTASMAINALEKSGNNLKEAIETSRAEMKEALAKKRHHGGIDLTDFYNPSSGIRGVFQDVNIYEVFRNVITNL